MGEVSEDELLAAARAGRVLDCGDADALGRVDAVLLRRCCQELKGLIDRRGIRLRRAEIMGCADLSGLEIPFSLRFAECAFDEPLVVEGAQLFELMLTGCIRLPGLLANGVQIRRDLDLSGTHLDSAHKTSASTSKSAAIWLCESDISTFAVLGGGLVVMARRCRADRVAWAAMSIRSATAGSGHDLASGCPRSSGCRRLG